MADELDLYKALGVARTATAEQIVRAYRMLARRHHPDTRAPGERVLPEEDDLIRQVTAAYAVLGDPVRRAEYDRSRGAKEGPRRGDRAAPAHRAFRAGGGAPVGVATDGPSRAGRPPIVAGPVRWEASSGRASGRHGRT
ncbi:J domain-containing protein [Georgenia yuyongxinii]